MPAAVINLIIDDSAARQFAGSAFHERFVPTAKGFLVTTDGKPSGVIILNGDGHGQWIGGGIFMLVGTALNGCLN